VRDLFGFIGGTLYPQRIVDHHDDPGSNPAPSKDPIKSYHRSLDQVSFDLLGPSNPKLTLHCPGCAGFEFAYPARRSYGYPFSFMLCPCLL
jgi:hypothetical protein